MRDSDDGCYFKPALPKRGNASSILRHRRVILALDGLLTRCPKSVDTISTDLIQQILAYDEQLKKNVARSRGFLRHSRDGVTVPITKFSKRLRTRISNATSTPSSTVDITRNFEENSTSTHTPRSRIMPYGYPTREGFRFQPSVEVKYLSEVSRCVRDALISVYFENPLQSKPCRALLERNKFHLKNCHSNLKNNYAADYEATNATMDRSIQSYPRKSRVRYQQRKIFKNDVGSQALIYTTTYGETRNCGISAEIKNNSIFKETRDNETYYTYEDTFSPLKRESCPCPEPMNIIKILHQFFCGEDNECICLGSGVNIEEIVEKWLYQLPMHGDFTEEDQEARQNAKEILIQALTKNLKNKSKWKEIIEKCFNLLPVWLPSDSTKRAKFRETMQEDLFQKLIQATKEIPSDRYIDNHIRDEGEKQYTDRSRAFKNNDDIKAFINDLTFDKPVDKAKLLDNLAAKLGQIDVTMPEAALRKAYSKAILEELSHWPVKNLIEHTYASADTLSKLDSPKKYTDEQMNDIGGEKDIKYSGALNSNNNIKSFTNLLKDKLNAKLKKLGVTIPQNKYTDEHINGKEEEKNTEKSETLKNNNNIKSFTNSLIDNLTEKLRQLGVTMSQNKYTDEHINDKGGENNTKTSEALKSNDNIKAFITEFIDNLTPKLRQLDVTMPEIELQKAYIKSMLEVLSELPKKNLLRKVHALAHVLPKVDSPEKNMDEHVRHIFNTEDGSEASFKDSEDNKFASTRSNFDELKKFSLNGDKMEMADKIATVLLNSLTEHIKTIETTAQQKGLLHETVHEWVNTIPFLEPPREGLPKFSFDLIKHLKQFCRPTINNYKENCINAILEKLQLQNLKCNKDEAKELAKQLADKLSSILFNETINLWVKTLPLKDNPPVDRNAIENEMTENLRKILNDYDLEDAKNLMYDEILKKLKNLPLDCDEEKVTNVRIVLAKTLTAELLKCPVDSFLERIDSLLEEVIVSLNKDEMKILVKNLMVLLKELKNENLLEIENNIKQNVVHEIDALLEKKGEKVQQSAKERLANKIFQQVLTSKNNFDKFWYKDSNTNKSNAITKNFDDWIIQIPQLWIRTPSNSKLYEGKTFNVLLENEKEKLIEQKNDTISRKAVVDEITQGIDETIEIRNSLLELSKKKKLVHTNMDNINTNTMDGTVSMYSIETKKQKDTSTFLPQNDNDVDTENIKHGAISVTRLNSYHKKSNLTTVNNISAEILESYNSIEDRNECYTLSNNSTISSTAESSKNLKTYRQDKIDALPKCDEGLEKVSKRFNAYKNQSTFVDPKIGESLINEILRNEIDFQEQAKANKNIKFTKQIERKSNDHLSFTPKTTLEEINARDLKNQLTQNKLETETEKEVQSISRNKENESYTELNILIDGLIKTALTDLIHDISNKENHSLDKYIQSIPDTKPQSFYEYKELINNLPTDIIDLHMQSLKKSELENKIVSEMKIALQSVLDKEFKNVDDLTLKNKLKIFLLIKLVLEEDLSNNPLSLSALDLSRADKMSIIITETNKWIEQILGVRIHNFDQDEISKMLYKHFVDNITDLEPRYLYHILRRKDIRATIFTLLNELSSKQGKTFNRRTKVSLIKNLIERLKIRFHLAEDVQRKLSSTELFSKRRQCNREKSEKENVTTKTIVLKQQTKELKEQRSSEISRICDFYSDFKENYVDSSSVFPCMSKNIDVNNIKPTVSKIYTDKKWQHDFVSKSILNDNIIENSDKIPATDELIQRKTLECICKILANKLIEAEMEQLKIRFTIFQDMKDMLDNTLENTGHYIDSETKQTLAGNLMELVEYKTEVLEKQKKTSKLCQKCIYQWMVCNQDVITANISDREKVSEDLAKHLTKVLLKESDGDTMQDEILFIKKKLLFTARDEKEEYLNAKYELTKCLLEIVSNIAKRVITLDEKNTRQYGEMIKDFLQGQSSVSSDALANKKIIEKISVNITMALKRLNKEHLNSAEHNWRVKYIVRENLEYAVIAKLRTNIEKELKEQDYSTYSVKEQTDGHNTMYKERKLSNFKTNNNYVDRIFKNLSTVSVDLNETKSTSSADKEQNIQTIIDQWVQELTELFPNGYIKNEIDNMKTNLTLLLNNTRCIDLAKTFNRNAVFEYIKYELALIFRTRCIPLPLTTTNILAETLLRRVLSLRKIENNVDFSKVFQNYVSQCLADKLSTESFTDINETLRENILPTNAKKLLKQQATEPNDKYKRPNIVNHVNKYLDDVSDSTIQNMYKKEQNQWTEKLFDRIPASDKINEIEGNPEKYLNKNYFPRDFSKKPDIHFAGFTTEPQIYFSDISTENSEIQISKRIPPVIMKRILGTIAKNLDELIRPIEHDALKNEFIILLVEKGGLLKREAEKITCNILKQAQKLALKALADEVYLMNLLDEAIIAWMKESEADSKQFSHGYNNGLAHYIEEWCNNLPVQGDPEKVKSNKQLLFTKLLNRIGELNISPDIFNDEEFYREVLHDGIEQLLLDVPRNPELDEYLPTLVQELISKILETRKHILNEKSGKYKSKLKNAIRNILPTPCNLMTDEAAELELLKNKITDDFLNSRLSQKCNTFIKNASDDIQMFYNRIKHSFPYTPNTNKLVKDLHKTLLKVPVPRYDLIKSEVEQSLIRDVISKWMRLLPLKQEFGAKMLHRYKLAALLAKELYEIENGKGQNSLFKVTPKMSEKITKFLTKLPLNNADSQIPQLTQILISNLIESENRRKFVPSRTTFNEKKCPPCNPAQSKVCFGTAPEPLKTMAKQHRCTITSDMIPTISTCKTLDLPKNSQCNKLVCKTPTDRHVLSNTFCLWSNAISANYCHSQKPYESRNIFCQTPPLYSSCAEGSCKWSRGSQSYSFEDASWRSRMQCLESPCELSGVGEADWAMSTGQDAEAISYVPLFVRSEENERDRFNCYANMKNRFSDRDCGGPISSQSLVRCKSFQR